LLSAIFAQILFSLKFVGFKYYIFTINDRDEFMKLAEVAEKLSCKLEGDGNIEINGIATLEDATFEHLSFLTNVKYQAEVKATKASAIIVGLEFPAFEKALLRHNNPYLTFAKALRLFYTPTAKTPLIHPTAIISEHATLGKDVSVGAYTCIGDGVKIGDHTVIESHCSVLENAIIGNSSTLHSGCVIRERVIIGNHCVIQSNSVIGSDGFGYAKKDDGTWYKILQTGIVILEDHVEVGALTTIDRATLGETRIVKGAKIDNLVQIGHGSVVGQDSLICAQVGMAGSTIIGKNVILTGQVGVAGHLTIGDNVVATPQTGIPSSIEPGAIISGAPAMEHRTWMKSSSVITRLPELLKTIRTLERRVSSLEKLSQGKLQS
jgi:UDP-3-O-[3-hydroxymyristoyl] glucosamine N-acyltransferase